MKIYLKLSYDGSKYSGFQKQKNGNAIQNVLENILSTFFNQVILTQGSSRTDAGVHAFAQVVTFNIENTTIPPEKFDKVLNKFLPEDIKIIESKKVNDNFHPRYNCVKKTYIYQIYNAEYMPPIYRNYMVHIKENLNVEKMRDACKLFVGEHDFLGFSNKSDNNLKSTVREIYHADVIKNGEFITFRVCGNGFLYNMVRIMAGTLIDIGLEKKKLYVITHVYMNRDRRKLSKTAPAKGLILEEILHDLE